MELCVDMYSFVYIHMYVCLYMCVWVAENVHLCGMYVNAACEVCV